MSTVLGALRTRASYFFIVVGIAWAAIGVLLGSKLVAWPAAACIVGGVLIMYRPTGSLTWAWGISTAAMGFIASIYQLYAWEPLLSGYFSTLATAAIVGFTVFAFVHVLLFYAGTGPRAVRSETS